MNAARYPTWKLNKTVKTVKAKSRSLNKVSLNMALICKIILTCKIARLNFEGNLLFSWYFF